MAGMAAEAAEAAEAPGGAGIFSCANCGLTAGGGGVPLAVGVAFLELRCALGCTPNVLCGACGALACSSATA